MNSNKSNVILGESLRKLRIRKNYSQELVASCLGISRNAYKDWESGKIDFSISKLEKICEFYDISVNDLINQLSVNYKIEV